MPRNVLILGAPRSGTSLLASLFARAGYSNGVYLWPPNENNPNGVREDQRVNGINDALLSSIAPRPPVDGLSPHYYWRWALAAEPTLFPTVSPNEARRILGPNAPICLKDPRFSYTLNAWLSHLEGFAIVCAFRSPLEVAQSLIRDIGKSPLSKWKLDLDQALEIWRAAYASIFWHYDRGTQSGLFERAHISWCFVDHHRLVNGWEFERLERFTGTALDPSALDRSLIHFPTELRIPDSCQELYRRLKTLNGRSTERGQTRLWSVPSNERIAPLTGPRPRPTHFLLLEEEYPDRFVRPLHDFLERHPGVQFDPQRRIQSIEELNRFLQKPESLLTGASVNPKDFSPLDIASVLTETTVLVSLYWQNAYLKWIATDAWHENGAPVPKGLGSVSFPVDDFLSRVFESFATESTAHSLRLHPHWIPHLGIGYEELSQPGSRWRNQLRRILGAGPAPQMPDCNEEPALDFPAYRTVFNAREFAQSPLRVLGRAPLSHTAPLPLPPPNGHRIWMGLQSWAEIFQSLCTPADSLGLKAHSFRSSRSPGISSALSERTSFLSIRSHVWEARIPEGARFVHVIRDPRDQLLESYERNRNSPEKWALEPLSASLNEILDLSSLGISPVRNTSYHALLETLPFETGLRLEMNRLRNDFNILSALRWNDPAVLYLRYEDIARSPEDAYFRIAQHFGYDERSLATLEPAIPCFAGIGRWVHAFPASLRAEFQARFADALEHTGYARDAGWVDAPAEKNFAIESVRTLPTRKRFAICTIVTPDYVPQAMVLWDSLMRWKKEEFDFHIFVVYANRAKEYPELPRGVFLHDSEVLCDSEWGRKIHGKYSLEPDKLRWSLKGTAVQYLLREAEIAWYLDSDLYFCGPYQFLVEQTGASSLLLAPHFRAQRPSASEGQFRNLVRDGYFNGGFVGATSSGTQGLEWWQEVCLHKCEVSFIENLFVDQRYLDLLPMFYPNVRAIEHRGCNVAAWNLETARNIPSDWVFIHFSGSTIQNAKQGIVPELSRLYSDYANALEHSKTRYPVSVQQMPEADSKKASVVVCTHNRPALLRRALTSLVVQDFPFWFLELIVVDNSPNPAQTHAVVQEFKKKIRVVHEPRIGLSYARNAGWEAANGSIVLFLDDDAFAPPTWVREIVNCFDEHPEAIVVGGPVNPDWEQLPPHWLSGFMRNQLSILHLGRDTRPVDMEKEWLVGANIAFRKRALHSAGGFHTDLGRKGHSLLSNEDNLLTQKVALGNKEIFQLREEIYYCAKAPVLHFIPKERLKFQWHLKRVYWQGRSDIAMHAHLGTTPKETIVPGVFKKLLKRIYKKFRARKRAEFLQACLKLAYFWGQRQESKKLATARTALNESIHAQWRQIVEQRDPGLAPLIFGTSKKEPLLFVILSSPRTGSSLLRRIIAKHPQIVCHGELFTKELVPTLFGVSRKSEQENPKLVNELLTLRNLDPAYFLENVILENTGQALARGFKLHYHQLRFFPFLHSYLLQRKEKIRVIYLSRANLLNQAVSFFRAEETGIWGTQSEVKNRSLEIPPSELIRLMELLKQEHDAGLAFARKFGALELTYEDLCARPRRHFNRIFEHLGTQTPEQIEVSFTKVRNEPLGEVVPNLEEIRKVLKKTPWYSYLETADEDLGRNIRGVSKVA